MSWQLTVKYNIQKVLLYMCPLIRLDGGDQIFQIKNWDTEFFLLLFGHLFGGLFGRSGYPGLDTRLFGEK